MFGEVVLALGLIHVAAGQSLADQLRGASDQITQLAAGLVKVTNDLNAKAAVLSDSNGSVGRMNDKIQAKYGNGCGDKRFRCGDSNNCIQAMFVCDGYTDCPNGEDETETQCAYPLPVGSKWVGYKLSDTCVNQKAGVKNQAEEYWIVTGAERLDYFSSAVKVTWQWYSNMETSTDTTVFSVYGTNTYTFYDRIMTGVVRGNTMQNGCFVDRANPRFIRCWAYRLGSIGDDCAPSVWYRTD